MSKVFSEYTNNEIKKVAANGMTTRLILATTLVVLATVSGQSHAGFEVDGNTLVFTDDDWYQVQTPNTFVTICNGASSCSVSPGDYIVINHTTGERWESVAVPVADASEQESEAMPEENTSDTSSGGTTPGPGDITLGELILNGNMLTFATSSWYQVQRSSDFETVCEGTTSCLLEAGSYIVINHTNGMRYEDVLITGSLDGVVDDQGSGMGDDVESAANDLVEPGFDGISIVWPDDGWYQIQDSTDFSTVCEGDTSCAVDSGTYIIVNLTTGERWEDFSVQTGVPATVSSIIAAGESVELADPVAEDEGPAEEEVVAEDDTVEATPAPVVEGNTLILSGPGWYQVQSAEDFTTVCTGLSTCEVPRGIYIVINHTTGERWEDIGVFGNTGVWFGTTSFGEGIFVIGNENNLYGLSTRSDGLVEAVFGEPDGVVQRFLHLSSRNPDHGTSFNLLGERPENINIFDMNDVDYNLAVGNDGQSLTNSGIGGNFSLTFATPDDVRPISVLSIAGQWESRTAFCETGCDITVVLEISNSGFLTGTSQVNDDMPGQLAGSVTGVDNSNLYLQIEFLLNGDRRAGVVYFDRASDSLILNTVGVDAGTGSLAAIFQRN